MHSLPPSQSNSRSPAPSLLTGLTELHTSSNSLISTRRIVETNGTPQKRPFLQNSQLIADRPHGEEPQKKRQKIESNCTEVTRFIPKSATKHLLQTHWLSERSKSKYSLDETINDEQRISFTTDLAEDTLATTSLDTTHIDGGVLNTTISDSQSLLDTSSLQTQSLNETNHDDDESNDEIIFDDLNITFDDFDGLYESNITLDDASIDSEDDLLNQTTSDYPCVIPSHVDPKDIITDMWTNTNLQNSSFH